MRALAPTDYILNSVLFTTYIILCKGMVKFLTNQINFKIFGNLSKKH